MEIVPSPSRRNLASETCSDTGQRVRFYRKIRGLSVRTAARLAGLSPAFLSTIENGHRNLDRISHVVAVADVLDVSPADLVGVDFLAQKRKQGGTSLDAAATRLRLTLAVASLPTQSDSASTMEVGALADCVGRLQSLFLECRYGEVLHQLPDLIDSIHRMLATGKRPQENTLRRLLIATYQNLCMQVLRELGYIDLMQLVVERANALACESDDLVIQAVSSWQQAQLCTRLGLCEQAADVALGAADQLSSTTLGTRRMKVMYGRLHITAALAHARLRPQVEASAFDHLAEARNMLDWLQPQPEAYPRLTYASFLLNKLELVNVLGHFDDAPAIVDKVCAIQKRGIVDEYSFHLLAGTALARIHARQRQAVSHLKDAEIISPHMLRADPYARRAISHLLAEPSYESVNATVRGLAYRMGTVVPLA
ncbi:helix-turn-helix domain-containing protein [Amycolatopsis sp. NPDC049868]|uniref:helix-turn-helix domain-containing protein n=1 Tax=Amycolatopsis sp. NPDC049868 TaxID=3363934 RepID=UPI0037A33404